MQKYRHVLPDIYNFSPQEYALLCVLLLRGPQTAGELRGRAERMAPFATLADAENVLNGLTTGDEPLVRLLPARPGQKERRFVQLLSGEPEEMPLESEMRTGERERVPSAAGGISPRVEALDRRRLPRKRTQRNLPARGGVGAGSGGTARTTGRVAGEFRGVEAGVGRVSRRGVSVARGFHNAIILSGWRDPPAAGVLR